MWGGGHVLQLASVAAMTAVWIVLTARATGRSPISAGGARLLYVALLLPWTLSPLLSLMGTQTGAYRAAFTTLMRWGIFPVVLVVLGLCVAELLRAPRQGPLMRRRLSGVARAALAASVGLTLLGFVLGAMIRGSNTVVPAHYHASIGGVTVAFMAMAYLLAEAIGWRLPTARACRLATCQPLVFGAGQAVFAVGFAIAGVLGMARKTYGHEQHTRTFGETIGLVVMGIGGLIAVAGGLLFLWIMVTAWRRSAAATQERRRIAPWRSTLATTGGGPRSNA
jgi:hypothetical protein